MPDPEYRVVAPAAGGFGIWGNGDVRPTSIHVVEGDAAVHARNQLAQTPAGGALEVRDGAGLTTSREGVAGDDEGGLRAAEKGISKTMANTVIVAGFLASSGLSVLLAPLGPMPKDTSTLGIFLSTFVWSFAVLLITVAVMGGFATEVWPTVFICIGAFVVANFVAGLVGTDIFDYSTLPAELGGGAPMLLVTRFFSWVFLAGVSAYGLIGLLLGTGAGILGGIATMRVSKTVMARA